jgi:hypothetical protein
VEIDTYLPILHSLTIQILEELLHKNSFEEIVDLQVCLSDEKCGGIEPRTRPLNQLHYLHAIQSSAEHLENMLYHTEL